MPTLAAMDILATGLVLRGTTSVSETIPLAVTRKLPIGEPDMSFFLSLKVIYIISCFVYLLYAYM